MDPMPPLSATELAQRIELVAAEPQATRADIERLCAEARDHRFHGVCVNGSRVQLAYTLLEESGLKVTGLVGYPLGASDADVKRYETEVAIDHGAHEIEMVINSGRLKDGDSAYVLRELRDIAEAADERPVKVVVEPGLLSEPELTLACELILDSGVHFVCTSAGLLMAANLEHTTILRQLLGPKFGVKASGTIPDAESATALIRAGADRLGTRDGLGLLKSRGA